MEIENVRSDYALAVARALVETMKCLKRMDIRLWVHEIVIAVLLFGQILEWLR